MLQPSGWVIGCDETGCDRAEQHESRFMLIDFAESEGWQRDVKLNGERAKRGGKCYCPDHRRPALSPSGL